MKDRVVNGEETGRLKRKFVDHFDVSVKVGSLVSFLSSYLFFFSVRFCM